MGNVDMTENEYIQACSRGDRYRPYAAFDCASAHLRLVRVRKPFQKLIARTRGSVVIAGARILANAEESEGCTIV